MKSRLKEILNQRGIKQQFIADKVGVHKATLTRIVKGKTDPSLQTAYRIAQVLGLKIEDIWYEEEE
jgi:DNA-binding XRE family transcriptional regulator